MSELRELPIELLTPSRWQPRKAFNQESLEELAESIRESGVVQGLVVRPLPANQLRAPGDPQYEIVAGERRWRAAGLAGLHDVPCIVRNDLSDRECLIITATENLQRENLNPVEEAGAYLRLNEELFMTHDEISAAVGKSRVHVTNMIRLLRLEDSVLEMVGNGQITTGHAKILVGFPAAEQRRLASRVRKRALSVRALERVVDKMKAPGSENGPRSRPMGTESDSDIRRLSEELSETLGTEVRIHWEKGRGRFEISFTSLDQAEGIIERLRSVPRDSESDGFFV